MAEVTRIEWTESTWNPWVGCRRVSPGCAHCYAEKVVNGRMRGDFRTVRRARDGVFNAPLGWCRPRRIFSCSISDFFIEEADEWRDDAWDLIRKTPRHTYQILTKRPERISAHLPADWGEGWPHVWLGVSGENPDFAFKRGLYLSQVPARVRFLSAEPWLDEALRYDVVHVQDLAVSLQFFDWVILGGESGPGCRPMSMESARVVRDACSISETPFFLKQLGGNPDARGHEKAILDGRVWKEVPA